MSWKKITVSSQNVEVEGHAKGDHTYCSATTCPIAQRCLNNLHDKCDPSWCEDAAAHAAGDHEGCRLQWCDEKLDEEMTDTEFD